MGFLALWCCFHVKKLFMLEFVKTFGMLMKLERFFLDQTSLSRLKNVHVELTY